MSVSSRHSARFRSFGLFLLLALPSLSFGLLTSLTSKSAGPAHHPSQIQSELLPATIQSSESRPQVIPGPEGSFFRVDGRALVQVLPNGERSVWHEFSETEAVNAQLLEIGGTLFGTTQTGGTQNLGTLFGFNPQTGEMMTIWNFGEVDGARPAGNLIADRQGNIYGTTLNGGEDDTGVVFRIKLDGTGYKPVFHYLKSDGYDPAAGLILLADGSVTPVITPTKPENPPVDSRRGEFQPAATFTVATATDLVNAINSANTNGQADIINLTANIGLTSALPTLASDSGNSTTINGGGFSVSRTSGSFRIFTVGGGAVVFLNNMMISNGNTGANGGGILNQGTLTVTNCTLSGNRAASGGAARNEGGTLSLTDCTLSGNVGVTGGGALMANGGTTTAFNCTMVGNQETDTGAGSGGGVSHINSGNVFLTNCTITGNSSASIHGAGGISIILGSGSINLANCTITSNTTSGPGGGIRNFVGSLNLRNTIVFGNTGSTPDIDGFVSFAANNLVGSLSGTSGITAGVNGNIVGSDPVLGPLASNGGPTQTQAIGCASPARDAGTTVGTPTTDQRGVTRDTTPDIGAFEGPLVVTIGSPTPPSFDSPGSVSFPVTYVGAVSVNLTNAAITVNTTGSVVGTANVTNGTTATPTVTVTVTSGVGTVGISIAAGTATGNCGSGPTSATTAGPSPTATVTTSANGIAEAGNNQTVCASSPAVTLNGSFSGGATSATWSGGAGSFNPNTSALNAVYTPSAGEIAAGTVTLTLTTNDPPGSGVAGSDTVVITINPVATVEAGNNQTVCATTPAVTLNGSVGGGASSGTWSGGAGSFAPNASTLNAVYTPSAGEISVGTVTLTLTTNDPTGPCGPVSDTVTITISAGATVEAGNPQTVCATSPAVTLNGSVGNGATTGTWSGGAGSFAPNAGTLNAVYTPSAGEISAGTVTLTLTTNDPPGACGPASDTVVITISPVATAEAGSPQTVCATSPAVTLAGVVGGSASSGTWSGGAGSFAPNASTLNALYTPSAGEISAGTVTLTLTSNDPAGPCGPASDTVTITINPTAAVDAGNPQTVCADNPAVTLAGVIGGTASNGTWSGGAGSFNPNAGVLNAVYTPSAGEISAGTVTLTLTTNDPTGPCGAVSDTVTITISPVATAEAGNPQTVCASSPAVTLAGTVGGSASSGTWSGGTGSFAPNASTLNAVYTPSAGEISAGTVTLTLTTNDPAGPCGTVSDSVVITIDPAATVDAGPNQGVCIGSPVQLAGIVGGAGSGGVWSGGAGSFSPNAGTLNAIYTPSPGEMTGGGVVLTLTTTDPAGLCGPVSDTVMIVINPEPTVDAGTPQTICSDSPVTLNGSIGGAATSATWSGGGSFSPNASALNAVYTPSAAEIAAGTATLSLTTNDPPGACTPVFDTVVITIEPRVTVDAGNNQTLCSDNPMVTLNGNIGGSATSATWSGGSGSFSPNAGTPNAVYMATPAEMQSGSLTLTLTTNDPAGVCGPASDSVTIFFINCGSDTVLWVADTNNNRIQRFDGQNWVVVGVGTVGSGDGQFRQPEAVVASSDSQRVYVADTGNNRIQWSTDGGNTWANFATNGTGLNQVRSPKGLAYDALGNLYVSDNGNGRVLRFNAGLPGNSVVIASNGTASGQIMSPHGMVIDGTFRLFVTDEAQSRILRINNASTVTTSTTGSMISAKGVGLNHVMNPQGLALDPAGNLFVADTGNSRILRWANGNPATGTAWALTGSALGQVNRPEGVAIKFFQNGPLSGDLFLVVSDTSNNRIQGRFLSAGPWNLVGAANNIGSGVGQFRSPSKIR